MYNNVNHIYLKKLIWILIILNWIFYIVNGDKQKV
jgi:hypothetical protein